MSRKSKLQHQFIIELKRETKFGESKHRAKEQAREEAIRNHSNFKQVRGIYSYRCYDDYKKSVGTYVNWVCKNHSEVKNIEQARRYIPEYVDELRDKGLSEWTIHSYAYALRCAFHCEISELGITLGTRSRADVIRNRDAADSALRNDERYEKVITLAKATGARRMELLRLRREDFRERTDCNGNKTGELEVYKRGKGGIERWCLVNPAYNVFVKDFIKNEKTYNFNGEERLLRKSDLPAKLPIHDCRSDYACALYNYYEERGRASGEIYSCRKDLKGWHYDKGILEAVSYDLQHSRNSIVVDYLWKGRE